VADMLQDKKIEVKSERDIWQKSGNIAIEYESYGKPSGIKATESDYWFHNLCIGDEVYASVVFKTDVLKRIIDSMDKEIEHVDKYDARLSIILKYLEKKQPEETTESKKK